MARMGDSWSATADLNSGNYDFPTGVHVQEMRVVNANIEIGTTVAIRMQRWNGTYRDFQAFNGDVFMFGERDLRRICRVGTDGTVHQNSITLSGYYVQDV